MQCTILPLRLTNLPCSSTGIKLTIKGVTIASATPSQKIVLKSIDLPSERGYSKPNKAIIMKPDTDCHWSKFWNEIIGYSEGIRVGIWDS